MTSTAAETTVQVTIKYKTVTHVWKFKTPASTKTTYKFGVGDPTENYKVTLAGTVIAAPKGYTTGASVLDKLRALIKGRQIPCCEGF